jgi:hypothetical protein
MVTRMKTLLVYTLALVAVFSSLDEVMARKSTQKPAKEPAEIRAFAKDPSPKNFEKLEAACKKKKTSYIKTTKSGPAIEKIQVRASDLDVETLFYLFEHCSEGKAQEALGHARSITVLRNPSAVIQELTKDKELTDEELKPFADAARHDVSYMNEATLLEKLRAAGGAVESAKAKGRGIQVRARLHIMIREQAQAEAKKAN